MTLHRTTSAKTRATATLRQLHIYPGDHFSEAPDCRRDLSSSATNRPQQKTVLRLLFC